MPEISRSLVNSIFARGLAAATIAIIAVQAGIPHAVFIAKVTYVVITGTIILSSIRAFLVKMKLPKSNKEKVLKISKKSIRSKFSDKSLKNDS